MILQCLLTCASVLPFELAHTLLVIVQQADDEKLLSCFPEGGAIAQGFGFPYWSPWVQAGEKNWGSKKSWRQSGGKGGLSTWGAGSGLGAVRGSSGGEIPGVHGQTFC